jgi:hypothetical protein
MRGEIRLDDLGSKGGSLGGLDVPRAVTAVSIGAWHKAPLHPAYRQRCKKVVVGFRRLVLIPIGRWPERARVLDIKGA